MDVMLQCVGYGLKQYENICSHEDFEKLTQKEENRWWIYVWSEFDNW